MDAVGLLRVRFLLARHRRRQVHLQAVRNGARMRALRDASNPFELPEGVFRGKFRLSRDLAWTLIEQLRPHMRAPIRVTAIPVELKVNCLTWIQVVPFPSQLICTTNNFFQVLSALHFLGHGSDQKSIPCDVISQCQTSVSVHLDEVVNIFNRPDVMENFIKFPQTEAERRRIILR